MAHERRVNFRVPALFVLVLVLPDYGQATEREACRGNTKNAITQLQNRLDNVDLFVRREVESISQQLRSLREESQEAVNNGPFVKHGRIDLQDHPDCVPITDRVINTLSISLSTMILDQMTKLDELATNQKKTVELTNGFSKRLEDISTMLAGPRDCAEVQASGRNTSGVYYIKPGRFLVRVYCEFDSNGTAWLVFQRRFDGTVNFTRGYDDYAVGFGDINAEFWLGNDLLNLLTYSRKYRLRIEMEDYDKDKRYAEYKTFSVGPPDDNYRLNVGGYSGDAGDSLVKHNGNQFSTIDADNDIYADGNCAKLRDTGGWWFYQCHDSNLNGQYYNRTFGGGINWHSFHDYDYSLKTVQMKIAQVLF